MSEDTTQTVVEDTKPPAQQGDKVDGARTEDTLDTLLAQYEEQTTKPPPSPSQTQQQEKTVDPDRLSAIENRFFQEDLNKAVTNIMGDLKVPRRLAMGWVDQMAREDSRIARAFLERSSNPDAWARVEKGLSKAFAKEMKELNPVDQQATEDREAVAAAVRGASITRAPENAPVNYGKQNNAEFRNSVREQYGFDPGV